MQQSNTHSCLFLYFLAFDLVECKELLGEGYSTLDIVTTLFKVVSRMPELHEWLKLEYLKVRLKIAFSASWLKVLLIPLLAVPTQKYIVAYVPRTLAFAT